MGLFGFGSKDKQAVQKARQDNVFNTETMLPFSEIRGNTIIMKDGSIRGVLRVTGLNLDLKNGDEQMIAIEQYKRFLNGLEFPVQILIRNAYLDLSDYISYMKKNVEVIENPVLQKQGQNYIKFLEGIDSQQGLIYVKEFYVIVPYYDGTNTENQQVNQSRFSKFMAALNAKDDVDKIISRYRGFIKNRKYLDTRCTLISDGLRSLGMDVQRLDSEDITSLLFKFYNPTQHNSQSVY